MKRRIIQNENGLGPIKCRFSTPAQKREREEDDVSSGYEHLHDVMLSRGTVQCAKSRMTVASVAVLLAGTFSLLPL